MKVGIDVLETKRVKKLSVNLDSLSKIFTQKEIEYIFSIKNVCPRLAGMYCAKEALLKALGVGVRNGIDFRDVEVDHRESGQPFYNLSNSAVKAIGKFDEIELSISHTDNLSTAICIIK